MATRCARGASPTKAMGCGGRRSPATSDRSSPICAPKPDASWCSRSRDSCDVIVENFRPGRLVEFGLDYDTVARTNPGRDRRARVGVRPDRTACAGGRLRIDRRGGRRHSPHHRRPRPAARPLRRQSRRFARRALRRDRNPRRAARARAERQGPRGRRRDLRSRRGGDGIDDGGFRDRQRGARSQRRFAARRRARPARTRPPTGATCSSPATPTRCSPASATPWAAPISPWMRGSRPMPRGARTRPSSTTSSRQWTRELRLRTAAATPRRARGAGGPGVHRARHGERPALPRAGDGAARHVTRRDSRSR